MKLSAKISNLVKEISEQLWIEIVEKVNGYECNRILLHDYIDSKDYNTRLCMAYVTASPLPLGIMNFYSEAEAEMILSAIHERVIMDKKEINEKLIRNAISHFYQYGYTSGIRNLTDDDGLDIDDIPIGDAKPPYWWFTEDGIMYRDRNFDMYTMTAVDVVWPNHSKVKPKNSILVDTIDESYGEVEEELFCCNGEHETEDYVYIPENHEKWFLEMGFTKSTMKGKDRCYFTNLPRNALETILFLKTIISYKDISDKEINYGIIPYSLIAGVWLDPVPSAISVFMDLTKKNDCGFWDADLQTWLAELTAHEDFEEAIADDKIRKEFEKIKDYIYNLK